MIRSQQDNLGTLPAISNKELGGQVLSIAVADRLLGCRLLCCPLQPRYVFGRDRVAGVKNECLLECGECSLRLIKLNQGFAQSIQGLKVVRTSFKDLTIELNCVCPPALHSESDGCARPFLQQSNVVRFSVDLIHTPLASSTYPLSWRRFVIDFSFGPS